jgi:hypothetical protein
MTTTRAVLTPQSAEFPTTNFPALLAVNTRPVLAFDATTSETCYWTLVAPQGFTGTMTAVISYMMASATSGGVAFDVAVEAITSADATDLDAASSFDTVNGGTDAAVPGTAGYMEQVSITLTNQDSAAAADYLRISLARDVADGADTATGDCYVLAVELRDAA